MNNARKKIAAGCMAVLLSMTSVYSVCAAETGIEAAGGSGSISAGAETAFVGNGNILYQRADAGRTDFQRQGSE